MKKYLLGFFAIILAVGLSAFTKAPDQKKTTDTEYYWYVVDYSVAGGQVAAGTPASFSGVKKTKAHAISNDGCPDINDLHCLRGFINQLPSNVNVSTFDESTPMPEE